MGGIVDKHHSHGGRSIGKALQSILPEIIDRPVRIRICLPVVFQRTQRLRRIQGDPALTIQETSVLRKKAGHEFAGAYDNIADGYR